MAEYPLGVDRDRPVEITLVVLFKICLILAVLAIFLISFSLVLVLCLANGGSQWNVAVIVSWIGLEFEYGAAACSTRYEARGAESSDLAFECSA